MEFDLATLFWMVKWLSFDLWNLHVAERCTVFSKSNEKSVGDFLPVVWGMHKAGKFQPLQLLHNSSEFLGSKHDASSSIMRMQEFKFEYIYVLWQLYFDVMINHRTSTFLSLSPFYIETIIVHSLTLKNDIVLHNWKYKPVF